ncbi:D-alanyl-D-alanine carboxypeptidase [Paenalkalicoccus suaedae]|uniref:D-alanyl-D-alanine carboxypeptidase n=2 Tax=Paenalkalicoccus suaedae TaxID=2592382 RepID=A0A859FK98_9BACI|nr:D-alanyl-D-alanine carboxypeptidase [Paenalkalicoccus suaedae]
MDGSSGRVLYEKQADEPKKIASITKIMTAILAISSDKLDEEVEISSRAYNKEGSSLYLQLGEEVPLLDLVYGLMLRSGNDAAVAIAEHVGGSEEGFVYLMNELAEQIGMTNTTFTNPHGLDDEMNHVSTARDMAILMRYAMSNEMFREVAKTKTYRSKTSETTRIFHNKNRLLTQLYDKSTGGKTGFTKAAGRTLVSTATDEDLGLIAVTLNAPSDWHDHIALFEWGFDHFDQTLLYKHNDSIYIEDKGLYVRANHDVTFPLNADEKTTVRSQIKLIQGATNEYSRNRPIGFISFYYDDIEITRLPLYLSEAPLSERLQHNFLRMHGAYDHD